MNLSDVLPCQSLDQPVIFVQPLCIVNHHSLFHHTFSDCNHLIASAHLSKLHEIILPPRLALPVSRHNKLQLNASPYPTKWLWQTFVCLFSDFRLLLLMKLCIFPAIRIPYISGLLSRTGVFCTKFLERSRDQEERGGSGPSS